MAVAKIDELKKLQFFKFCKNNNFDFRIFDVFGIGVNSIIFAESIQQLQGSTTFKMIRAIDMSEFVVNFSSGNQNSIKDYLKATNDFLFDYRFENFSYKEIILK